MARVPKKDWGPEFRKKTADQEHEFSTMDGTEYILYAPNFKQYEAYAKSLKKYKDVFDRIKADIKDDDTIAKSKGDGLPKDLDHVEWTALLSNTLKKLNKTWGVNDKIWIYNKEYDDKKSTPMYLAITPKITQRNAIRGARKVSAAAAAGSEFIIDPKNVTFGPSLPPITQYAYVITKNGLTYYYHTEKDVDKDNHFMIENAKGEQVDKNGEIFDPGEDFRRFVQEGQKDEPPAPSRAKSAYPSDDESEDDYQYESDNERNDYDYNDGIPPYPGARWDYELEVWVSDPMDPEIYDEEGNYRILSEDIVVEPEPEPAVMLAPAQALIQPQQKSRREKLKDRMREMMRAKNPQPDVVMPPPTPMPMPAPMPAPPAEDPRIVEARIGLPSPWEAYISTKYNRVYYIDTSKGEVDNKGQWERPTIGGKRTRKHPRPKPKSRARAKQPKKKRTSIRRKRTTTTRRRK
jgi:hypothetical protein